ncbi:MAG: amino acid adenylation domain-containing protein [Candidatus Omnitrophota bacterium]
MTRQDTTGFNFTIEDLWIAAGQRIKEKEYWLDKLSGEWAKSRFPSANEHTSPCETSPDRINFRLDGYLYANVMKLSANSDVRLHIILSTLLTLLVGKYSGTDDILIGTPVFTADVCDDPLNTVLVLRNQMPDHLSFKELLLEVRQTVIDANANMNYPLEILARQLNVPVSEKDCPFFDVAIVLENIQNQQCLSDVHPNVVFLFSRNDEWIACTIEYHTHVYSKQTMEQIATHFLHVIEEILPNPEIKISEIDLITEKEKTQILYDFNQPAVEYPKDKTIHELFDDQVNRGSDKIALIGAGTDPRVCPQLSYKELNKKSEQLAYQLIEKGVKPDTIVGITIERSIEMIIGLLAILKAGGAYLPIDPDSPQERIDFMLNDSRAKFLLATEVTGVIEVKKLRSWEVKKALSLDHLTILPSYPLNFYSSSVCSVTSVAKNLSYVIYTSGSTGAPKGVMIEHRNVLRLVWHSNYIDFLPGDRLLLTGATAFDITTFEIWGPLLNGITLICLPKTIILDVDKFKHALVNHDISILHLIPQLFNQLAAQDLNLFAGIRCFLIGGDSVNPVYVNQLRERFDRLKILHMYGPTENTTFSTFFPVDKPFNTRIPIGKPIAHSTVYIMDKNQSLQPVLVTGELFVGGDGLARGYLNHPEMTAERFCLRRVRTFLKKGSDTSKNFWFGRLCERLYKTGDLGRWLDDGNIEFLGRGDSQVKIRGFRVEPGEIENRLVQYSGIKEGIVAVKKDPEGNNYLAAYVVSDTKVDIPQLKAFLSMTLPDYMIPAHIVPMETLPITSNGKIDYRALPEPVMDSNHHSERPRDAIEIQLAELWSELLNVDRNVLTIDSDFFALGGHSLKAALLASKIHQTFNVNVSLSDIFEAPTIRALSDCIRAAAPDRYFSIACTEEKEYYVLSSAQKRLYMLQQMDEQGTEYNMPALFLLEGEIDKQRFEQTFEQLIDRHESLRTSFHMVNDEPVQRIMESLPKVFAPLFSKSGPPEAIIKSFIRPFCLSSAPLMRVELIRVEEDKHLLAVDMHHIISDGTSMNVLVNDFMALYRGETLPELRIQYKDVAEWQNRGYQRNAIKRQEDFWLNEFALKEDIPVLELPVDFPRPPLQRTNGGWLRFDIHKEETDALKALALETGTTLYMVLLSIYTVFLSKLTGQEDIVVGSPAAGRRHVDLEPVMGMFVNTLALRHCPLGEKWFKDFLHEVKEYTLKAFENQDYPFEDLVERTVHTRDTSRHPIFETMFALQNMQQTELTIPGLSLKPYAYEDVKSPFDLTFTGLEVEVESKLSFTVEYAVSLFKRETVERFCVYFRNLINGIIEDKNKRISDYEVLTEEEKTRILCDFNDTAKDYPREKTIHGLLEDQVRKAPDQIALIGSLSVGALREAPLLQQSERAIRESPLQKNESLQISYSELNEQADRLADELIAKGVTIDTIVGLKIDRSIEMIIGILGILKAGGAYLPIDPEYPQERVDYILKDSNAELLLTQNQITKSFCPAFYKKRAAGGNHSLAYIIYTSGTTGNPKGVMVEHRNVVAYIYAFNHEIRLTSDDTGIQLASFTFDAFVEEVFSILLNGSRLLIPGGARVLDMDAILRLMIDHRVTIFGSTPLVFNELNKSLLNKPAQFHTHIFSSGGDVLKPEYIDNLLKIGRVLNVYGPTESTVCATYYTCYTGTGNETSAISIGKPIRNYHVYILDRYHRPVPIGVHGELCISGDGITRGYLNRPELTSTKYLPLPKPLPKTKSFCPAFYKKRAAGGILYKTGDLAKWNMDGNIEFLGRVDQQVKIRGIRIELGEIEACILSYKDINDVVVMDRQDGVGEKYLCAYIVSENNENHHIIPELRDYVSSRLPDYMVPAYVVLMERMPLNASGKVNRKALPEPEVTSREYEGPVDEIETRLVELWSEVLHIEPEMISVTGNFFEMGGHSLKATALVSKIHRAFDIKIPLMAVFNTPRIRDLANHINDIKRINRDMHIAIEPAEEKEYYRLSPAQKRLYVLHRLIPDNIAYNMPFILPYHHPMEGGKLESIFNTLIHRHESFRTSFITVDDENDEHDEPVQRVHESVDFSIDVEEIEERDVNDLIPMFTRPFDLNQAPLLRVKVLTMGSQRFLFIDMHHIITDGGSQDILENEFKALASGGELAPLRLQYKDYSEWFYRPSQQEAVHAQERFWLDAFSDDIPVLHLPTDHPRPVNRSTHGKRVDFGLDTEQTHALKQMVGDHRVTPYMYLLAVFTILLAKLSGQDDIVIGTPVAARRHEDLQSIIGMLINTLAIRNYPSGEKLFNDFLRDVREGVLGAYENQEYPFEMLVDRTVPQRDTSRNPLFDVMFNYLNDLNVMHVDHSDGYTHINHINENSKFDLTLTAVDSGETFDSFHFRFTYSTALFEPGSIERMIRYFKHIVDELILSSGEIEIADIAIMDDEEKRKLLEFANGETVGVPQQTVMSLFETQVAQHPDHCCTVCMDARHTVTFLTYREVNRRANRIALILKQNNIGPGAIVGIMVTPSWEMVVGIMGIVKAGCVFLPIEPESPADRIDYVLQDSSAAVLLTQTDLERRWQAPVQTVNIDDARLYDNDDDDDDRIEVGHPSSNGSGSDPLYVIVTSGTTGRPKGVLINNANLMNYANWFIRTARITRSDQTVLTSSFAFDMLYTLFFSSLLGGCPLHVIPRETFLFSDRLLNYLKDHRITYIKVTPSHFNLMVNDRAFTSGMLGHLRLLILGGEEINVHDVEKAHRLCPHFQVMNHYGPTETTIGTIAQFIDFHSFETYKLTPTIGRPIYQATAYILDRDFHPVPPGVTGYLWIGGKGVGMGYLNRPELTLEKFIGSQLPDAGFLNQTPKNNQTLNKTNTPPYKIKSFWSHLFSKRWAAGGIFYKTGDLARWRPDGHIEFLGRADDQVKIRGYRIEPGEVEARLLTCEGVKEAVVMVRKNRNGETYLCAYFISERPEIDETRCRAYLAKTLPLPMIPSYFVRMEKMPLTKHHKLDRWALPDPEHMETRRVGDISPRNEIESALVDAWERVLDRKPVGIHDNFFQVGGDSIKCIRIISRMNSAGYKIEMKDFFQYPVIAEMAPHVTRIKRVPLQSEVTGPVPLTPIQARFFHRSHINHHYYNQSVMLYAKDGFDPKIIRNVFTKIQAHHDALRMTYSPAKDTSVQFNNDLNHPISFEEYHLKTIKNSWDDFRTQVNRIQSSIDPEKGPLIKLGLFHSDDGDRLLIVIHHLVVDGVSWRILLEDIATLYDAYTTDHSPVLPMKTDSFKLWAETLSIYANSPALLKEKTYWSEVESADIPPIPKDDIKDNIKENMIKDVQTVSFSLDEEKTHCLLTHVNRAFHTEINDILLTALGMGINQTFGIDRVAIALEGHGREAMISDIPDIAELDISRTVGWFTSVYPVVLDVCSADRPGRQIKEVKETLRKIPNKGIGYGILNYLTDKENISGIAFKLKPPIIFNYLGQVDAELSQTASFQIIDDPVSRTQSPDDHRDYDLEISGMTTGNRLTLTIAYNKHHFHTQTMDALIGHFESALIRLIDYCGSRERTEPTPGDFMCPALSIDQLDRIMETYPDIQDLYPLTPLQEGLWFHAMADRESASYFQQTAYRLQGTLDLSLIETSLNELVRRHDILRTAFVCFVSNDMERPVQVVLKERSVDFYFQDITQTRTREEKETFLETFKENDRKRSFELSRDPLLRVSVIRLTPTEYELIWSSHHIVMDGWCFGIINSEFFEIYHSHLEHRAHRLPAVKPYRTYIQWLEKHDRERSARYWDGYLESFDEATGIPRPRFGAQTGYRNEAVSIELGRERTLALNRLAGQNRVTVNTVMRVMWGILLGRYNGTEDVVFGAVVSGRPHELEGVETMVGLFINTVPVRIRFHEHLPLTQLLRSVQEDAVLSESYHYDSLADIQSRTALKQHLIDHLFVFENYPTIDYNPQTLPFTLTRMDIFEQSHYDFGLLMAGTDDLHITFKYNGNAYNNEYIERIAGHLLLALDQVIANEGSDEWEIRELDVLSQAEKDCLLNVFNKTQTAYPQNKTVYELFEDQVEKTPDQIALIGSSSVGALREAPPLQLSQLSYNELNERSGQLADDLMEKGVGPDIIVAIKIGRTVEMIIGILGILKAGGAYLPIDPSYPQERMDYILKDSNAKLLITQITQITQNQKTKSFWKSRNLFSKRFLAAGGSHSLSYVIYTSGSTGKPKGVLVNQSSFFNTLYWRKQAYNMQPGDRALQLFSFAFDGFITSFFTPVLSGATVIQTSDEEIKDIFRIKQLIALHGITHFISVPSFYRSLLEISTGRELCGLKTVTLAGEEFPVRVMEKSKELNASIEMINEYGPTEGTVVSTFYRCTSHERTIPIGKPIANVCIYIIDKYENLVPIGIAGELAAAGNGLARGYLNRPELTGERFSTFLKKGGAKNFLFYKTGDLGRWLEDGNIEFLGRLDAQVKIRGFRIELGEIEAQLKSHPHIRDAVVISKTDTRGDRFLCAYLVSDQPLSVSDLKNDLHHDLPDYMIPSSFVFIDHIPLTINGKLDRKQLPEPGGHKSHTYIAPRNEREDQLAEIWSSILGIEKTTIGIDDNFFDLGGHSLKATSLASSISKRLRISIPLPDIFQTPTIRGLSEYIRSATHNAPVSIEPLEKKDYYLPAPVQKRLFALQLKQPDLKVYNIPLSMLMEGDIDEHKLQGIFQQLVNRHESLRTYFRMNGEDAVQRIDDHVNFDIETNDLTDLTGSQEEPEKNVESIIQQFIRPFDLTRAPLIRVGLVKLAPHKHILMMDSHHIITDGISQTIIIKEFVSLYLGKELPFLRIHPKDYVQWQVDQQESPRMRQLEDYWFNVFRDNVPVLVLPYDYPPTGDYAGGHEYFMLDRTGVQGLHALADSHGATFFMILLALFNLLLSRISGQNDIVVGTPTAGRKHADLEPIVGLFVSSLALRNQQDDKQTFHQFLDRVKHQTVNDFENQDYPVEALLTKVNEKRENREKPLGHLYNVMLVLQNIDDPGIDIPGLTFKPYPAKNDVAKYELVWICSENDGHMAVTFEYRSKLFKRDSILRFESYFKQIVTAVLTNPDQSLAELKSSLHSGIEVTYDNENHDDKHDEEQDE